MWTSIIVTAVGWLIDKFILGVDRKEKWKKKFDGYVDYWEKNKEKIENISGDINDLEKKMDSDLNKFPILETKKKGKIKMNFRDFLDSKINGCENFYWKEAIWCNQWQVFVIPEEYQYENIIKTAQKLEEVRKILKKPMTVTSWLRPKRYNRLIKGATFSQHITGLACDFQVKSGSHDEERALIEPHLDKLKIRMEKLKRGNWIHIDLKEIPDWGNRYFHP